MLCTVILVYILSYCNGLKILSVLPMPMKSHHIVFNSLFEELVDQGHQVTVYSGHRINTNASNYSHILIKTSFDDFFANLNFDTIKDFITKKHRSLFTYLPFHGLQAVTEEALRLPQLKELIESNEKYDVIVLETFFTQEALIGFGYKFNAPVVTVSSLGSYSIIDTVMGNPNPVSYIPNIVFPFNCDLTLYQRFYNSIKTLYEELFSYFVHLPRQQAVMERYFGKNTIGLPHIQDLISNVSVVLLNSQPEVNYARPYLPNMIQVGGLHIKSVRTPLPQKIQTFMDEVESGVIYFSLGSTFKASSVPDFFMNAFIKAFAQLQERIVWKVDSPPTGLSENVMTVKWAAQVDILAHPKCKGFITHGGLLSMMEATHFAIPLIGIPLFADQNMNVAKVEHSEIGVRLDVFNLSSESVLWALDEILHNAKYKRNIEQLSASMRDRQVSPLETAVYWIQYVAKHNGAPHFRSPARNMSFFRYWLIDVMLFIFIVFFVCTLAIYLVINYTFKLFSKNRIDKFKINKKIE